MTKRMRLAELMDTVRPGSQDWTWADEARDLWDREPDEMHALGADLLANGQTVPVTIGDDGRLWDGHHRVVALDALAEQWVNVRYWHELTSDEQIEALIEGLEDMEAREWRQVSGA